MIAKNQHKNKAGFKVPDGYFENLEKRLSSAVFYKDIHTANPLPVILLSFPKDILTLFR